MKKSFEELKVKAMELMPLLGMRKRMPVGKKPGESAVPGFDEFDIRYYLVHDQPDVECIALQGKTGLARAAILSAKIEYVSAKWDIPKPLAEVLIHLPHGMEDDVVLLVKECWHKTTFKPQINEYGQVSNVHFVEWVKQIGGDVEVANRLSGPRANTVIQAVLGKDWESRFSI